MTPKNYILGSGLLGLLARKLLGHSWEIIPYGRSRFYSYNPALNDNFIVRDERLDDFISHLGGKPSYLYKLVYSHHGALHQSPELCDVWLDKIFGHDLPQHLPTLFKQKLTHSIYNIKANILYEQLTNEYMPYIKEAIKNGNPTQITKEDIIFNNKKEPYNRIISTIPLPAFAKLCGYNITLPSKQVWYHHIETNSLDFEGANQVRVVDNYSFFKCSQIAPTRFLFYSIEDIITPGPYFARFMPSFEIIDGTTIERCIPAGNLPDISFAADYRTTMIGASANWDWGLDISSALIRLLKQH